MTFTQVINTLAAGLFLLLSAMVLWFAWNDFWEWIEKKWGGKDK